MAEATPFPTHKSSLRASGLLVTTLTGRVTDREIREAFEAYVRCGRPERWLLDATEVTGYTPEAMSLAVRCFTDHAARLERVVVAITRPVVRMGAQVVAMASRAPLQIVGTVREAEARMQEPKA